MADGIQFDIDAPDLRSLLQHLRDADPQLATALRRQLRESGDAIIAEQRQILSGAKPGGIRKSGSRLRLVRPRNGRRPYFARRNVYETDEAKTGGVSNLRDQISSGLRTRVVAGKSRQSVSIKTTGPRAGGYNMAVVWQKAMFRHPVFGSSDAWVYQQGQPYFFEPIRNQYDTVRDRIAGAVDEALRRIAQR